MVDAHPPVVSASTVTVPVDVVFQPLSMPHATAEVVTPVGVLAARNATPSAVVPVCQLPGVDPLSVETVTRKP